MKILTAEQIRHTDAHTIEHEPITSIDLMERASQAFTIKFSQTFTDQRQPIMVFAGPGNNGGDALAVARMLLKKEYAVRVFVVSPKDKFSEDCQTNLERITKLLNVFYIKSKKDIPAIPENAVIVDGLFGSGLSRPVEGLFAEVINQINASQATVVAVDIPSGLFCDQAVPTEAVVIHALHTFTFQLPKLAFLMPQNGSYVGNWHTLDIGLDQQFIEETETNNFFVQKAMIRPLIKKREKFSHKGTYGKALLFTGGIGKMGAAVLCSRACLRTGVGLLTVHIPKIGYSILQTAVPEAMALVDQDTEHFSQIGSDFASDLSKYDVVGVGPGIGTEKKTFGAMKELLRKAKKLKKPMVLDADALNICAKDKFLLNLVPPGSILTPHPIEFERISGKADNDFQRLEIAREFAKTHQIYLILKGAYTVTVTPEGNAFFNSTGNSGMATGGSGDVLTGMVTSLLAQGYSSFHAAMLGVYLHGMAGDIAASKLGEEAMLPSDIINSIGEGFKRSKY